MKDTRARGGGWAQAGEALGFCAVSRLLSQHLDVFTNHPPFRVLGGGFSFVGMIKSLATGDWAPSPALLPSLGVSVCVVGA